MATEQTQPASTGRPPRMIRLKVAMWMVLVLALALVIVWLVQRTMCDFALKAQSQQSARNLASTIATFANEDIRDRNYNDLQDYCDHLVRNDPISIHRSGGCRRACCGAHEPRLPGQEVRGDRSGCRCVGGLNSGDVPDQTCRHSRGGRQDKVGARTRAIKLSQKYLGTFACFCPRGANRHKYPLTVPGSPLLYLGGRVRNTGKRLPRVLRETAPLAGGVTLVRLVRPR